MAGRLSIGPEGKQVECEDQGVVFVEATAENCLAEPKELSSLAPFMRQLVYDEPSAKNILEMPLFIVQVTTFKCGGFVLGLYNHHYLMDGLSANEFLLAWGELVRGVANTHPLLLTKTTAFRVKTNFVIRSQIYSTSNC